MPARGLARQVSKPARSGLFAQARALGELANGEQGLDGHVRASEDLAVASAQRAWFEDLLSRGHLKGVACVRVLASEYF